MKQTIHLIAAARPNFMKIAPLYHSLARETWCRVAIVHTGQHYDANMSDTFFRDLRLPDPAFHLDVCLLYTSPSPRDRTRSRMPSSA